MSIWLTFTALILLFAAAGYVMGRGGAMASVNGDIKQLHSTPGYYGWFIALWCAIPAGALAALIWAIDGSLINAMTLGSLPEQMLQGRSEAEIQLMLNDIQNIATGNIVREDPAQALVTAAEFYNSLHRIFGWSVFAAGTAVAAGMLAFARSKISPQLRARNQVEWVIMALLIVCSVIAILTTLGIVLSLLFETARFFARIPFYEFFFGLQWSPQIAIRADQVGASGAFGMIPLFAGTLLITTIAMLVAVPVGLLAAIYMSEYASSQVRSAVKPLLEILAGIPTVVYGFFAIITVAPLVRRTGEWLDANTFLALDVSSQSALAAGVVMGIMIVPFVSSLSDDVINAVPQSLRDGSYAVGATHSETITKVVLPAALPGIVGAVLLAISKAVGETMIVTMAAGLQANITANPLEAVTTVTVQIVTLLTGDQEFDSAKTLAAFALGLTLFVVTLLLNFVALRIVQRYREKYE